jgi:aspartate racemase
MARRLESAGADLLILPCNTAHFFIGEALRGVAVPFIDMIDETVKTCRDALPGDGRIGLLATSGTLAARVYHDRFETTGLNLLVPGEAEQQRVMEGIYQGVKAGRLDYGAELLEEAAAQLIDRGAQLIIGGCTEVPLVLGGKNLGVPFIDTLDVLAATAVNRARPHSSLEGDRSPA